MTDDEPSALKIPSLDFRGPYCPFCDSECSYEDGWDCGTQIYYAECLKPGEDRGLRMSVALTTTAPDQVLPELIPHFSCFTSRDCPAGGAHDLLPIDADEAERLMADEDEVVDPG